jgi:hypothetical protein
MRGAFGLHGMPHKACLRKEWSSLALTATQQGESAEEIKAPRRNSNRIGHPAGV